MEKAFEDLEREMNNYLFFLEANEFICTHCIADNFQETPNEFITKFWLLECIRPGYTKDDFLITYRKVKELLKKDEIDSEELPILSPKTHSEKRLQNVWYVQVGNTWTYEEKEDCR